MSLQENKNFIWSWAKPLLKEISVRQPMNVMLIRNGKLLTEDRNSLKINVKTIIKKMNSYRIS